MINKIPKSILAIFLTILFLALLSFSISAVDATTGYTVDADGNLTNIKYTMTEDGTLSFEIDKESSNASSTVIVNRDPITGTKANYKTCNPTYEKAVKIIIGEGITEISGFAKLTQLTSVEIPTSLKTIEKYAFEVDTALTSIYLKGTTPLQGTFDLSHIEKIGTYTFDSCPKLTKVILNPSYCYEFGTECFKNTAITEIEIPSGTTVVKAKAFTSTKKLHTFTVLGMETVLESDDIFKGNTLYPAIKAKSGSKAAEFAIKNGYTFIDLDSGEIVQGTKATAAIHSGSSEGDTSIKNRIDTDKVYSPAVTDFNPQGATVWGHSSGQYNGKDIINTWWAYYGDTKTLEFVSATTNYNETGSLSNVDKQYESWDAYKNEIEHIIIGDNIRKVSMSIFSGYTNLKDVKIGRNVVKIDTNAFFDCPNLTTLWREGTERVEGRIDLTGLVELSKIFRDNSFTELVIPESVKEIKIDIPQSVKAIYTYQVNDKLIEYAKTNLFNLINMNNPSESYNYWIEIDNTLPSCGPRCV
ncbi:MAG: leucine-rich repeat protein, partial [Clostridia bacterium]|nr:leucine-rich repeat protein [Clostridia bacterium]